jgi:hypothetical protein
MAARLVVLGYNGANLQAGVYATRLTPPPNWAPTILTTNEAKCPDTTSLGVGKLTLGKMEVVDKLAVAEEAVAVAALDSNNPQKYYPDTVPQERYIGTVETPLTNDKGDLKDFTLLGADLTAAALALVASNDAILPFLGTGWSIED